MKEAILRDLDQLVVEINKRYIEIEGVAKSQLQSAIEVGICLLEAQAQVPPGTWLRWVEENLECSATTAQRYMKFAAFRVEMASAGVTSIQQAIHFCKAQLVRPNLAGWSTLKTDELVALIKSMKARGMGYTTIAADLGISYTTARSYAEPTYAKRIREQMKESQRKRKRKVIEQKRALRQIERDELARSKGGRVAEAYSLVRRLLAEIDRTIGDTEDPAVRAALVEAMKCAHRAEDNIVAALKGKDRPEEVAVRSLRSHQFPGRSLAPHLLSTSSA